MADTDINQDVVAMVKPFEGPVPGQSLTNPPGNYAWEKPPEFVTVKDALDDIYISLIQKEKLLALVEILAEGAYDIITVAQMLLEKGWRDGKWNTELMLLLAEPTIIIIMAIAERAGIGDYEIYQGENQELDEEDADQFVKDVAKDINQDMTFKGMKMPPVKKESVPTEILESIETAEIPKASLLQKPA
jgi:hypothetical protein